MTEEEPTPIVRAYVEAFHDEVVKRAKTLAEAMAVGEGMVLSEDEKGGIEVGVHCGVAALWEVLKARGLKVVPQ